MTTIFNRERISDLLGIVDKVPKNLRQGCVPKTAATRRMRQHDRDRFDKAARRYVFINFKNEDEGKSSVRIGLFEEPEFAVAFEAIHEITGQLCAALREIDDRDRTIKLLNQMVQALERK